MNIKLLIMGSVAIIGLIVFSKWGFVWVVTLISILKIWLFFKSIAHFFENDSFSENCSPLYIETPLICEEHKNKWFV